MEDGIVLSDGRKQVIINLRSYYELVKWLIVEYAGVSCDAANTCVELHRGCFEDFERTFMSASLEEHSWPYYYLAMDFYFGDCGKAVPVKPPPDGKEGLDLYMEIENRIMRERGLKPVFIAGEW